MGQQDKRKINLGKFFVFDKVALIIGFIVDTVTLVSILISLRLSSGNFVLPHFVTPWTAFGIWILGEYIYLAILYSYWEKNCEDQRLKPTFFKFLTSNIILGFQNPFLSFLGLVSLLILIWIAYSEHSMSIASIVGVAGFIFAISAFIDILVNSMSVKIDDKQRKKIDENWNYLRRKIREKLARKQWLSFVDLEDVAVLWNIDLDDMVYALAKYGAENTPGVAFGDVYRREDDEKVNGDYSVLISIENINDEKYYYTG